MGLVILGFVDALMRVHSHVKFLSCFQMMQGFGIGFLSKRFSDASLLKLAVLCTGFAYLALVSGDICIIVSPRLNAYRIYNGSWLDSRQWGK